LAGPPDELGFGIVVFDLLSEGGARQHPDFPRWNHADGPRAFVALDGPGGNPPAAKWNCVDCPAYQLDLQQLTVGVAPHEFGAMGIDPRWTIGRGPFPNDEPGEYMGFLLVNWDGMSRGFLTVDVSAFALYDEQLDLFTAEGTKLGGQVLFGVPEPGTGSLAVAAILLGVVCAHRHRRHRRQGA
jgi:hypothetical protein